MKSIVFCNTADFWSYWGETRNLKHTHTVINKHTLNLLHTLCHKQTHTDLLVVFAVSGDHLSEETDAIVDAGAILLLNEIVHLSLLRVVRWRVWGAVLCDECVCVCVCVSVCV